ncbi:MAG: phosphatase domain-containing protein [Bacteroidales bacterium]
MLFRLLFFPFRYGFARLKKAIGKLDVVVIEPLYAFGNEARVLVQGRVVESYKQSRPSARKTYLQNLLGTIRRYAGSSVPEAKVEVEYQGAVQVLETDTDGIFQGSFGRQGSSETKNQIIRFRLLPEEGLHPEQEQVNVGVQCFPSDHPRGIISDIDDTILISHATRVGRKFWLSISKNAYTRRPFPGVSAFYKALTKDGEHPVFYISSSDWNLVDLIRDFLDYRNIPQGTMLLKDLHVDLKNIWKSGGGSHQHKLEKTGMLLELFPGMKFILIGDSGQHDPELYAEVITRHPGRILAVYIREVRVMSNQRRQLLEAKLKDPDGPSVVFVKNTGEAMDHARTHSIIS